jgi:hypothetical protein
MGATLSSVKKSVKSYATKKSKDIGKQALCSYCEKIHPKITKISKLLMFAVIFVFVSFVISLIVSKIITDSYSESIYWALLVSAVASVAALSVVVVKSKNISSKMCNSCAASNVYQQESPSPPQFSGIYANPLYPPRVYDEDGNEVID